MNPTEIETERLLLRQWRPSDFEPFAELNADARVMAYFPSCLDRAASDALARRSRDLIAARGWGLWAVEVRASGTFAGFVGLNDAPATLPFSPCVEIGWRLAYPHWGKGFAPEAARAALRVGFETLHLAEIVSFTSIINTKSRIVMEKLGMKLSSTFEHPNVPQGSPLREHCLYRLTREKWRATCRR